MCLSIGPNCSRLVQCSRRSLSRLHVPGPGQFSPSFRGGTPFRANFLERRYLRLNKFSYNRLHLAIVSDGATRENTRNPVEWPVFGRGRGHSKRGQSDNSFRFSVAIHPEIANKKTTLLCSRRLTKIRLGREVMFTPCGVTVSPTSKKKSDIFQLTKFCCSVE